MCLEMDACLMKRTRKNDDNDNDNSNNSKKEHMIEDTNKNNNKSMIGHKIRTLTSMRMWMMKVLAVTMATDVI